MPSNPVWMLLGQHYEITWSRKRRLSRLESKITMFPIIFFWILHLLQRSVCPLYMYHDVYVALYFFYLACVDTHQDCKYLKDRCAERAPVRRLCPKTCGVQCGKFFKWSSVYSDSQNFIHLDHISRYYMLYSFYRLWFPSKTRTSLWKGVVEAFYSRQVLVWNENIRQNEESSVTNNHTLVWKI